MTPRVVSAEERERVESVAGAILALDCSPESIEALWPTIRAAMGDDFLHVCVQQQVALRDNTYANYVRRAAGYPEVHTDLDAAQSSGVAMADGMALVSTLAEQVAERIVNDNDVSPLVEILTAQTELVRARDRVRRVCRHSLAAGGMPQETGQDRTHRLCESALDAAYFYLGTLALIANNKP